MINQLLDKLVNLFQRQCPVFLSDSSKQQDLSLIHNYFYSDLTYIQRQTECRNFSKSQAYRTFSLKTSTNFSRNWSNLLQIGDLPYSCLILLRLETDTPQLFLLWSNIHSAADRVECRKFSTSSSRINDDHSPKKLFTLSGDLLRICDSLSCKRWHFPTFERIILVLR